MQSRELVKLYYRIGEVSEIVGVQPHVLRYWETEFRSIRPQKSSKGQRVYSRRDVEKLLRVKDLLRNQGFTIAGARKRLSDVPDAAALAAAPVAATPVAITPAAMAPVAVVSAAAALEPPVTERGADHSSKDMRKALLGLRQDLMRMLDEISALQARR
jgi:DNA-binding transcriptional MerR regulator